jgi:hypothetical protein
MSRSWVFPIVRGCASWSGGIVSARRRVEEPPDAGAPQGGADAGDDSCVAAEPGECHRGEDGAECEHGSE